MTAKKTPEAKAGVKPKCAAKLPPPKFSTNDDGEVSLHVYDENQLCSVFGGTSEAFSNALADQCCNISGNTQNCEKDKDTALAVVHEIAPQDGIEGLLAVQMASVHIAMMRHSRLMAGADTLPRLDVHERVFNKLARTFTTQMEALRKHRHGGQQKMTVEHVTVQDGGQAIVGNVTKGGG